MPNFGNNPIDRWDWQLANSQRTIANIRGTATTVVPQTNTTPICGRNIDQTVVAGTPNGVPIAASSVTALNLASNPSPTTTPSFTTAPHNAAYSGVFDYVGSGSGSFDAVTSFIIDNPPVSTGIQPTLQPTWLDCLRFYAIPTGTSFDAVNGVGIGASKCDVTARGDGTYNSVRISGLSAGTQYDIYLCFIDHSGAPSAGALIGTTTANPLALSEFVGGIINSDGSLSNIDQVSSASLYALIAGQPMTINADIISGSINNYPNSNRMLGATLVGLTSGTDGPSGCIDAYYTGNNSNIVSDISYTSQLFSVAAGQSRNASFTIDPTQIIRGYGSVYLADINGINLTPIGTGYPYWIMQTSDAQFCQQNAAALNFWKQDGLNVLYPIDEAVPSGWTTTGFRKYDSLALFLAETAGTIPAGMTWAGYDPEAWYFTPVSDWSTQTGLDRGNWYSTLSYNTGDCVRHAAQAWVAVAPSTNVEPTVNATAAWSVIVPDIPKIDATCSAFRTHATLLGLKVVMMPANNLAKGLVSSVPYSPPATIQHALPFNAVSGTSNTFTMSFTPAAGDTLVCFVQSNATTGACSANAGWTQIDNLWVDHNNNMAAFWRTVQAGDTATITPCTIGTACTWSTFVYHLTGADPTNPINVHSLVRSATSLNPPSVTCTSITPTVANCVGLMIGLSSGLDTVPAAPTGWSSDGSNTTINSNKMTAYHYASLPTSATAPTLTWGSGTAQLAFGGLIAIKPAPGYTYGNQYVAWTQYKGAGTKTIPETIAQYCDWYHVQNQGFIHAGNIGTTTNAASYLGLLYIESNLVLGINPTARITCGLTVQDPSTSQQNTGAQTVAAINAALPYVSGFWLNCVQNISQNQTAATSILNTLQTTYATFGKIAASTITGRVATAGWTCPTNLATGSATLSGGWSATSPMTINATSGLGGLAAFEFQGNGSPAGNTPVGKMLVNVIQGTWYTLSFYGDCTNCTVGGPKVAFFDSTNTNLLAGTSFTPGQVGRVPVQYQIPVGTTQVTIRIGMANATVSNGNKVRFSQPMLEVGQTSGLNYVNEANPQFFVRMLISAAQTGGFAVNSGAKFKISQPQLEYSLISVGQYTPSSVGVIVGNQVNGYKAGFDAAAGTAIIAKYVNGVETILGTTSFTVPSGSVPICLTAIPPVSPATTNTIEATIGGLNMTPVSDSALNLISSTIAATITTNGENGKVYHYTVNGPVHYSALPPSYKNQWDITGFIQYSTGFNKSGAAFINVSGTPVLSWTTTSTTISLTVPSVTYTLQDLSTVTVSTATDSRSSLTASTTYYWDVAYNARTNAYVLTFYGSTAPTATQMQTDCYSDGFINIYSKLAITTNATGGSGGGMGGGGDSGGNSCPADYQEIETLERGFIPAREIDIDMHIRNGDQWVRVTDAVLAQDRLWRYSVENLITGKTESFDVNASHVCKNLDDVWVRVDEMIPGQLLRSRDAGLLKVVGAEYLGNGLYVALEVEGHEYTLGESCVHNPNTL